MSSRVSQLSVSPPWGQTEFQVNLKLGLTSHARIQSPGHSQDGPSNHAPTRSVCTAAAVASLRARFSHSCGINVSLASLGRYARTCERYHGLFSPGSRPTASSQTWSASPTGLRARWACGLMVLGTTKCLHETWNGRFSVRSGPPGRSEERNSRQGGSACRWPQVFHTQAIRLRPMTLFNPVFNCVTP